jgi:inhibitor of cysteine peptidase
MKNLSIALVLCIITSGLSGQMFEPGIALPQQGASASNAPQAIQITAKKGSTFTVPLSSNPTTGYQWSVTSINPSDAAQFVDSSYTPQSNRIGGGGTQTLTFNALKSGKATLHLGYSRSREKAAPARTQQVQVTIQ